MDNPEKMCNNYIAHWLYLMVVDMKNTKCATGRTRTDYTLRALDFIPVFTAFPVSQKHLLSVVNVITSDSFLQDLCWSCLMFKRRCNANQYHEYVKEKVKKHLNMSGGQGGEGL
jgi:hypothetical protein